MAYEQYRPSGFSFLPQVVKNLLIINGIMFFATIVLEKQGVYLLEILGLHSFRSENFRVYQLITYMFMHGGFAHIIFNMFALWMFGTPVENAMGKKRFLQYYLFTGLGAAITYYAMEMTSMTQAEDSLLVGASGAVFGILLAFGWMFPNTTLIMIPIPIPIKAKYFVILYGLIELFAGFANVSGDNVAHFAHLGGLLFGILLILYWKHGNQRNP